MKIINQSFELLPEKNDPVKQIAERCRICYKSENKAKEDERPFLKRIWKHEPIFEMAVISLNFDIKIDTSLLDTLAKSKYLHFTLTKYSATVTGSIRAWREVLITAPKHLTNSLANTLVNECNFFFKDLNPTRVKDSNTIRVIDVDTEPTLNNDSRRLHKHVAVKFITNRAVSHELVRHRPCAFLQESQRYCRYGNEVVFINPQSAFPNLELNSWMAAMEYAEDTYLSLLCSGASPQAARTVLPNSCKTEIIVYANLREWEHIFNRRVSPAAEPSMREQMGPLLAKFQEMFPDHFTDPQLSVG